MFIAIVEDNKIIANNIHKYFKLKWIKWDVFYDGEAFLNEFDHKYYDLVILDITLPWIDGFQIAKKIKSIEDVPILFLTAKVNLDDKKLWYNLGAEDYITKPIELEELYLKVHTIWKRLWLENVVNIKNIEIDLYKRIIKKDWEILKLPNNEFLVLEILVKNKWRIVSKADIIEELYGEDGLFDNKADAKIDTYIYNLRKKLGKEIIATEKWIWYLIK